MRACRLGKTEILTFLLSQTPPGNKIALINRHKNPEAKTGPFPLYLAIQEFHIHVFDLLIKNGADLHQITETYGNSSAHVAAAQNRTTILAQLFSMGVDIDLQIGRASCRERVSSPV